MKRVLTFDYWYGDKVTLTTDPEKKVRVISGITIRPSGRLYELACGENTTWHQSVEIEPVKVVNVKGFR
jgi:hypothetical protein